jgi:hypothetical protein
VLDGLAPAHHTAVAPPSSARCRARCGGQASRRERPLPCPPSSASTALYRGMPPAPSANADGVVPASRPMPSRAHRNAARACLAAVQGGHAGAHPITARSDQHCSAEPAVHQNRHLTGE